MRSFFTSILSSKRKFILTATVIIFFAFLSRLYRISYPSTYFFDEVYHAFTATTYLQNDPKGYEFWQTPPKGVAYEWTHPPLAKLIMAESMAIFGQNSFGWRISSVIFGTIVIILSGVLSYLLFQDQLLTLFTLFILSLDNLLLTMSRIAMNDMHCLAFALAGIIFYLLFKKATYEQFVKKISKQGSIYLLFTGIFLGLSLASKWTALYVIAGLSIDFLFTLIRYRILPSIRLIFVGFIAVILLLGTYMLSYTQFFLQPHMLDQCIEEVRTESRDNTATILHSLPYKLCLFRETTKQMWWYHTNLKATHSYQSQPLQWIFDLRPVWMHVDYSQNTAGRLANIYNIDNPLVLWFGLIAAIVIAITLFLQKIKIVSKKTFIPTTNVNSICFILFFYLILWVPWLASPRIMFFYHYAPAIPFLGMLLAFAFSKIWIQGKTGKVIILFSCSALLLMFITLYPLSSGMFMPRSYTDTIFTFFPSWK